MMMQDYSFKLSAGLTSQWLAVLISRVRGILLILACSVPVMLPAQDQMKDPLEITQMTVNDVMTDMQTNQAVYSTDRAKLNEMVQQRLLPRFNFEVMTQLAVGRPWMQATPAQKSELLNEFRTLLVRTYTNVLFSNRNQKTEIRSRNTTPQGDVSIEMEVSSATGDPVRLALRMRDKDGDWKVIDVSVDGVSLIVNYRTSFSREINQSGIDGLVKSLVDKNRQNLE